MDNNLGQVVLVKDINTNVNPIYGYYRPPSARGSYPGSLIEFKDKLYFSANDGENGNELFVSDGTATGTQLVADINPNINYDYYRPSFSSGSNPGVYDNNDRLSFPQGSFPQGSYPYSFIEFNNKLYFSASDGKRGSELWVSDGTAEGTQLLAEINPASANNIFDDEGAGSNPSNFVEFNNKLYFSADDGESGRELFVSDGTAEGTQLLVDLNPGVYEGNYGPPFAEGSNPSNFIEFNDKLYFSANDGENGNELFVSDGTAEGTKLLVDLNPGSSNYGFANGSYLSNFVEFNGKLYFSANDGESGNELFVSDGTAEGTQLLVDLNPGVYDGNYGPPFAEGSNPRSLVEFNGKLYFSANDGKSGSELWVSDGTAEGTQLLVDLRPNSSYGFNSGSYPYNLVEFNNKLYFTANDGESGDELYVTDGTAEGTQLVADINPNSNYGNNSGSYASELTVVGNELFFRANDGEVGTELFKLTIVDDTPVEIVGSDRADNLVGSDLFEDIQALGGRDTIDSGGGNDTVDGGNGSDFITSASGNNNLIGGRGKDTIDSGNGNDTLFGDHGRDVLTAGSGDDFLSGGQGQDTLNGGDGFDTLFGDNGSDVLVAGSGDDFLAGGKGRDTLDGGIGFDTLEGNGGQDLFVLRKNDGTDTITDFKLGRDSLGLADGLEFDSLSFSGSDIKSGTEILATLNGIDTQRLTVNDFESI